MKVLLLTRMYLAGYKDREIADALGDGITAEAVRSKRQRQRLVTPYAIRGSQPIPDKED